MAKKPKKSSASRPVARPSLHERSGAETDYTGGLEGRSDYGAPLAETTGRMIVTVLDEGSTAVKKALASVASTAGLSDVCHARDFATAEYAATDEDAAELIVLDELGVIVINGDPDQNSAMQASAPSADTAGIVVEPEYWNYPLEIASADVRFALDDPGMVGADDGLPDVGSGAGNVDFLRGYRQGVNAAVDLMLGADAAAGQVEAAWHTAAFFDTAALTWGVQATRAHQSPSSGSGIRVAVLDTGMDLNHPDFAGRPILSRSFIPASEPDNQVQDINSHGTHCIGTACGPRNPGVGPRYGVAYGASIYAGKVLAHNAATGRASGADGWILGGINWALANRCHIVSMSLGAAVSSPGYPTSYERAANRGLRAGTLIIAAAGNDSDRRVGSVRPVARPANCPSIAAVAAVDSRLRVAYFSNAQRFGSGGEINLTGPGVNVRSSVPGPARTGFKNGTSMATPHAAGIAALVGEETGLRGLQLYREVARRARPLGSRADFGNGLVEAL